VPDDNKQYPPCHKTLSIPMDLPMHGTRCQTCTSAAPYNRSCHKTNFSCNDLSMVRTILLTSTAVQELPQLRNSCH
jgi:hypothetical protein